jgi:hypothetical protein
MPDLDMDKAKAARIAAKGQGPRVTFGGVVFELDPELSFEVVELLGDFERLAESEAAPTLRKLLVMVLNGRSEEFLALNPTTVDVATLLYSLPNLYGMRPGESNASSKQSETTSEPSRPTSPDTTA